MNTASNQEPKSHCIQSSGMALIPSPLVIIVLFVSIFSGFLVALLGLDAIFVIATIVGFLLVFPNTYRGLFVLIIVFPLLVGFSPGVDVTEKAFAVLFGVWLLGWIARSLLARSGKLNFGWHPIAKPALAMGTLLVIGVAVGLLNGAIFIDIFRDLSQYVGYLIILPIAIAVRSRKRAWRLFIVVTLIGIFAFSWSFFVWRVRKFGIDEYGSLDIAMIGAAYAGPIIGALWLLVILRTGWRMRLLAIFLLLLLLFFTLGSGYRGQIVLILVMICVAIWGAWTIQSGRQRIAVAVPLIIGATFLFWFIGGVQGHLPLLGEDRTRGLYAGLISPQLLLQDLSVQGRLMEAQASLVVFRGHPIIGRGLGHRLEHPWWGGGSVQIGFHHHVGYTETLMKFGIVGALVFIWYFGSILRFAFVVAKKVVDPWVKAVSFGVIIWIIASLATAVVGSPFSNRGFTFTLGLMAGILPALAGWYPYCARKAIAENILSQSQCRKVK